MSQFLEILVLNFWIMLQKSAEVLGYLYSLLLSWRLNCMVVITGIIMTVMCLIMILCRYILIMVKPKAKRVTARQRVERNAEKPVVHTKNDDVATIVSTAKSVSYSFGKNIYTL